MQIHNLKPKTKRKKAKLIGRGGKRGTYSGRGIKGQRARSGHRIRPELRDIIKRLPKKRGESKKPLHSLQEKVIVISLAHLEEHFASGDRVTRPSLLEKGLLRRTSRTLPRAKILSNGELSKALVIEGIPVSASAREEITKRGGTIS